MPTRAHTRARMGNSLCTHTVTRAQADHAGPGTRGFTVPGASAVLGCPHTEKHNARTHVNLCSSLVYPLGYCYGHARIGGTIGKSACGGLLRAHTRIEPTLSSQITEVPRGFLSHIPEGASHAWAHARLRPRRTLSNAVGTAFAKGSAFHGVTRRHTVPEVFGNLSPHA